MTSATEKLRRMLDVRGVKWTDRAKDFELTVAGFADTRWDANGSRWCYIEIGGTATLTSCLPMEIRGCTPEQAIAATLGSERESELVRAIEDVLRHSTDTVWVGEAETLVDRLVSLGVYKHDVYEGARPCEVD